jgi:hypothetical protein
MKQHTKMVMEVHHEWQHGHMEKDMPNVACISGIKVWAKQSQGEPDFGNMLWNITQRKNCMPFF